VIPNRSLSTFVIVMTLLFARNAAVAQHISAVTENGHTVWVNDADSMASQSAATTTTGSAGASASSSNTSSESATSSRPRMMVYWSHTEHRWKPVGYASPQEMKAARSALRDVERMVNSHYAESETLKTSEATPAAVEKAIQDAASRHGIDENLVRAIIQVESGFNPHAVSHKGAMGLMQLMPQTARSLDVRNPFDPEQNVDAGVRHFKKLLENYNGDVKLSLAAYNAGSTAVDKHHAVPNIAETTSYVKRITSLYGGNNPWGGAASHISVSRDAQGHLSFSNIE